MDTHFDEIVIKVTHSSLAKIKNAQVTTNTTKTLLCRFEFKTEEWAEMTRTAVFAKKYGRCCTVEENPVHVLLGDDNVCEIPAEVLEEEGEFKVGVFGIKGEEVLPTNFLIFKIKEGCFSTGTEPAPPTPTIYQQILNSLEKKQDKLEAGAGITIEDGVISATSANNVVNAKTHLDFPSIGNSNVIYKAEEERKLYQWDEGTLTYVALDEGMADVEIIHGGNASGDQTIEYKNCIT